MVGWGKTGIPSRIYKYLLSAERALTFFFFIHIDGAWISKPQAILSLGFVVTVQSCDTVYYWRWALHETQMSAPRASHLATWESFAVLAKRIDSEAHFWRFWFRKSWDSAWGSGNSEIQSRFKNYPLPNSITFFFFIEEEIATFSENISFIFFIQLH